MRAHPMGDECHERTRRGGGKEGKTFRARSHQARFVQLDSGAFVQLVCTKTPENACTKKECGTHFHVTRI